MQKTSKSKLAELIAIKKMVGLDHQVALPFGGQAGWDFLFLNTNKYWLRVQVKCAYRRHSGFYVDTMKGGSYVRTAKNRKYVGHEFDRLMAVDVEGNKVWDYSMDEVLDRRCVRLDMDHLLR